MVGIQELSKECSIELELLCKEYIGISNERDKSPRVSIGIPFEWFDSGYINDVSDEITKCVDEFQSAIDKLICLKNKHSGVTVDIGGFIL